MKKIIILLVSLFCFAGSAQHHHGHTAVADMSKDTLIKSINYLEEIVDRIVEIQVQDNSEGGSRCYQATTNDFIEIVEATGKNVSDFMSLRELSDEELSSKKSSMTVEEVKSLLGNTNAFSGRSISIELVSRFALVQGLEQIEVTEDSFCSLIESTEERKVTLQSMINKLEKELEKR